MLPYIDVVYASDTSFFFLPYAKLAQGPEGGAFLALQNSSTHKNMAFIFLFYFLNSYLKFNNIFFF